MLTLLQDSEGYFTFSDRLGDTYRVKGHNISTTEVENCLIRHPDIAGVNVYAIPMNQYGYEGQLGCAAIELQPGSRPRVGQIVAQLEQWMVESDHGLPAYAIPRFLRVLGESSPEAVADQSLDREQVSAIMKKVKVGLRKEGFTPARDNGDAMYWIEKEGQGYVSLREDTVQSLQSGKFRL